MVFGRILLDTTGPVVLGTNGYHSSGSDANLSDVMLRMPLRPFFAYHPINAGLLPIRRAVIIKMVLLNF